VADKLQCKGMNLTQIIGLAAGLFTASSLIPQVVKTLKEKKAEDVSMLTLLVLITGVSLWIVYGIMRDDLPIIATNAISFLVNVIMIVLRVKYNR
jgi:MtN3 and saliva related transmembrane protein